MLPRQGDGRRRDADRRRARDRAGRWRLRRRLHRQHLVVAARRLRGGAGDARRVRARAGARERAGARARSARGASASWRSASRRIGDVRAVGCFLAIEFVRDPRDKERDPELQDAVAAEALRRGVLTDSSSTSLNLQPSLAMPPAAARSARWRSSARRSEAVLAASRDERDARAASSRDELDAMREAGTMKTAARRSTRRRGRDRGCRRARRGDLPVLERLPRASPTEPRVVEAGGRGAALATAPGPPRCASSAALFDAAPRARARPGRVPRHRGGDHLRLVLEREPGAARRALRRADRVLSDELNHASIIDGIRLARPGGKAVYEHADVGDAASARWRGARGAAAALIVTDGVFSMEGDLAPAARAGRARGASTTRR